MIDAPDVRQDRLYRGSHYQVEWAGLCFFCQKNQRQIGDKLFCADCRRRLSVGLLSTGKCCGCRDDHAITPGKTKYCFVCWLKKKAKDHLGDSARWEELLDLWHRQDGRCAYTGVQLLPGVNASLDHITPKILNQERSTDISNVQWIVRGANTLKRAFTEENFLDTVRQIAEHRLGMVDGPGSAP